MPGWVAAILDNKPLGVAVRALATYSYWNSAIAFVLAFPDGPAGAMAANGLNPPLPYAIATIVVLVVGSALVIQGRWAWLGAGALGVFTLAAASISHGYWRFDGPAAVDQQRIFQDKMTIIGGLFLAAYQAHRARS